MNINEQSTTGTSKNTGLPTGKENEGKEKNAEKRSNDTNESGMQLIPTRRNERRLGYTNVSPIPVSEQQFMAVKEEHLTSMNLLNSSGNALLSAMEGLIPHPDSGRVVGEYTATAMRQLAKSVCDIVQTKTSVVRSMYQIARDDI